MEVPRILKQFITLFSGPENIQDDTCYSCEGVQITTLNLFANLFPAWLWILKYFNSACFMTSEF